ncbi:SymE family type I addiction module toxin [Microbulbifer sp. SSSA005]
MKGKWLAKTGFTINTPVTIEVSDGKLILRLSKQPMITDWGFFIE